MAAPTVSSQNRRTSEAEAHSEGFLAHAIEDQTARLPSDAFLWAAFGAVGASLLLRMMDRKEESAFVGQWVAPFMLFGVYNKLVKVAGSDRTDRWS